MKRFLSWVVLWACFRIFCEAQVWFWKLFVYLFNAILNFSEVLFWVLVVCEGATALGFISLGIFLCSRLIVYGSQAICPSRKGFRFTLLGVIYLIYSALILVGFAIGVVAGASAFNVIAECLTIMVFCIVMITSGKSTVTDFD